MGSNKTYKVHTISVEEILKHEKKLYIEDSKKVEAIKELGCFLREIGSKNSVTFLGFIHLLRGLKVPPLSENLAIYIRSRSNRKLKEDIKRIILKETAIPYGFLSSWKPNELWERAEPRWSLFGDYFYYYSNKSYVNVYSIPEKDLPLYINHEFSIEDKEIYKNKLRGV